eukprot:403358124
MATQIPNRPPDTPVQKLITQGGYSRRVSIDQFKIHQALPVNLTFYIYIKFQGAALSIIERNKRPQDEVNIKPITQLKVSPQNYKPGAYLNPFDQNLSQFQTQDMSQNSLHSTRIFNRKTALMDHQARTNLLNTGRQIQQKDDFNKLKSRSLMTSQVSSYATYNTGTEKLFQQPKSIALVESHNYISQHENEFYKNSKLFYKPLQNQDKYQFSTPDFLRVSKEDRSLERMNQTEDLRRQSNGLKNQESPAANQNDTITILSRSNGWLTVDKHSQNRNNALDKQTKGNMHKSSNLSPQWMQQSTSASQINTNQNKSMFKAQSLNRQNLRCENNRVLIAEPQNQPKSIFSIGQFRHNLMSKEDVKNQLKEISGLGNTQPIRLLEWKEEASISKYKTRLPIKIGQREQL